MKSEEELLESQLHYLRFVLPKLEKRQAVLAEALEKEIFSLKKDFFTASALRGEEAVNTEAVEKAVMEMIHRLPKGEKARFLAMEIKQINEQIALVKKELAKMRK